MIASRRSGIARTSRPVVARGLGPGDDLVEDGLPVLAARVLVRDDHEAAALAGDPAHQRALGRVALARRPEDGDQAAPAAAATGAIMSSTTQRGR